MQTLTISSALREALREEMIRDEKVFVIGEDIGHYGGTFGVTRGLLDEFGADRIYSSPISENAIVGAAVGAAMAGMRPVAEIMFCDFMTCGMDQIVNFAAMLPYASGGQIKMPLVIRTTIGSHGGPQHSKSLEAWLAHVPGLKVVMPATPYDAKGLLKSAIREDNPIVFFENRHLYRDEGLVPDEEYFVPIGSAVVRREGEDLTVIATSRMVKYSLEAAELAAGEGLQIEVIDARSVSPLDEAVLTTSARKTGRVLIVHEAWRFCGIGAEIASMLYENIFAHLKQPIRRLAHADVPHPYSRPLEAVVRPDTAQILSAVQKMLSDSQDGAEDLVLDVTATKRA